MWRARHRKYTKRLHKYPHPHGDVSSVESITVASSHDNCEKSLASLDSIPEVDFLSGTSQIDLAPLLEVFSPRHKNAHPDSSKAEKSLKYDLHGSLDVADAVHWNPLDISEVKDVKPVQRMKVIQLTLTENSTPSKTSSSLLQQETPILSNKTKSKTSTPPDIIGSLTSEGNEEDFSLNADCENEHSETRNGKLQFEDTSTCSASTLSLSPGSVEHSRPSILHHKGSLDLKSVNLRLDEITSKFLDETSIEPHIQDANARLYQKSYWLIAAISFCCLWMLKSVLLPEPESQAKSFESTLQVSNTAAWSQSEVCKDSSLEMPLVNAGKLTQDSFLVDSQWGKTSGVIKLLETSEYKNMSLSLRYRNLGKETVDSKNSILPIVDGKMGGQVFDTVHGTYLPDESNLCLSGANVTWLENRTDSRVQFDFYPWEKEIVGVQIPNKSSSLDDGHLEQETEGINHKQQIPCPTCTVVPAFVRGPRRRNWGLPPKKYL